MKKKVLEGNILPKAKQRLFFEGLADGEILYLSRDVIEVQIGVIDLPDQTKVPGGRRRAGEFTVSLQFARDQDREPYLEWCSQCLDDGTEAGISPFYKRNGHIIYHRLFQGSPGTYNSGSDVPPVRASLYGCWPSSYKLPDYDMNGDEGDGDCKLELTLQFDDAEIVKKSAVGRGEAA